LPKALFKLFKKDLGERIERDLGEKNLLNMERKLKLQKG